MKVSAGGSPATVKTARRMQPFVAKARDPVCGMMVDPATAPAKGTYDGVAVYFCSAGCQKTYEARRAGR